MKPLRALSRYSFTALAVLIALAAASLPARAVTVQEEIDLGKKIHAEILKQNQLYPDESAQKEMQQYGQNLAKGVKRTEIPYHFYILKDNDFNAFSIPGGYVYFTDRLWRVLRKDERIGVIGHEITHVDRRHAIDMMLDQQRRQIWLSVLLAAARANNTWGNIAGMAEQMYTLKYSRADEQQADEGAVDLCQKAGYNPAGILLAMYKIKRFEDESGGAPPKIFSDHPPTKERQQYITSLLQSKGIPVPPENVQEQPNPYRIGQVTSVNGNSISFTSSKPLQPGNTVWVMRNGWDFYYEKRTPVPMARAVVKSVGSTVNADVWVISSVQKAQVAKDMEVYDPPMPSPERGIGTLRPISREAGGLGRLMLNARPQRFERFLAYQAVWNNDRTQLVNDSVGYLVITNESSETGYQPITRLKYSYAPMDQNSVLVKLDDPDQQRWVGPVISIGKSSQAIEIMPSRQLSSGKTYEVLYPAWNKDDTYRKRVVGTARLQSTDKKVVLKITSFSSGWSMADIQNGFDVYEVK